MSRPVALVTGASMGIGLDLARELARSGHDLILVARNETTLRQASDELTKLGARCSVLALDLAEVGSAQRLYQSVLDQGLTVEVLINSAGFGLKGPFMTLSLAEQQQMMHLNIVTLTELCRLFGRDMARRRSGRILNIGSVASFQPGPEFAVYSGSKAYVLIFSESLDAELRPYGVHVTALCPGAVHTNFHVRAKNDSKMLLATAMQSAPVAAAAHRALMAGKPVIVPGLLNKLAVFFVRLLPRRVVTAVAYALVGRSRPLLE